MVAIQMATGSAVAAITALHTGAYPVIDDPKKDAAVKAGVGVALILASILVKKNGWVKQGLVGLGAGLAVGGTAQYFGA